MCAAGFVDAKNLAAGRTHKQPAVALRYGAAVGLVVGAWLIREAFTVVIGPTAMPFITFFPAAAMAAWYGGLGAGLLAIALGGATASWCFIEPVYALADGTPDHAARLAAFVVGSLVIVVGFASMHRFQRQLLIEGELRRRVEIQLAATLSSIGDAVIAVDTQSRVRFLNAVAERLTGWQSNEAAGRLLSEVFSIVNEDTRQPAENPVDKALRLGIVVGLANHTILIAKDGTEIPIDDSAAPIRDVDGTLFGVVLVFRDVSEQRAVSRAKAHLAAIVEHSGDAIVTKNLQGIIQSWNIGAAHLFGYLADEVIGKPVTILFPPERLDEEAGILRRLHEGLPFERFETIRVAKNGRRIPVSLSISPMRDEEGRIIGASKIIHDISEIVAARDAAERASQMKDEFLATLSHELRTPLNAVLGYATLMRMGSQTKEEIDEATEIIERNARVQAQLIEDLLDMNRIVTGKLSLQLEVVPAADVVDAALNTVRPSAETKQIRLVPDLDAEALVRADPNRLQQVVWNLLTNAVKFTPAGGEVRVAVRRTTAAVKIVVSDSGLGIEPEFLPHVFERFRQADASSTRRHGGLGLGLAIVRHLVELQGGEVQAASEGKDRGAEFTVTLPRVERRTSFPSDASPSEGATKPLATDLGGLRVLVVDDEPDAVALIERTLRRAGADVVTAYSAREALDRVAEGGIHILLSDISMPEEDGYTLVRRLREHEGGRKRIAAVALTAFAGKADRERAMAAGFDLHLAKPIEPANLPDVIARLMR